MEKITAMTSEDIITDNIIVPDYDALGAWESYQRDISVEFEQSLEEGLDVERYGDVFRAAAKMEDCAEKEQIADALFRLIMRAPVRADYPYAEPSDLESIRKCRGECACGGLAPDGAALEEKIRGAWLGRIAGCLLGKTVEGIRTYELDPLLKETGNYPMSRYIRKSEITEEMCGRYEYPLRSVCYADTIDRAPADDDTNYTVMAQMMIEKYGRDFTPADVGATWVASQPKNAYCTAERVAFRNLVNGYMPPKSAIYKNPYREWIGAQIRADYYGYINPGDPRGAAETAWRDASISHVKNGIYGAMFVAAMIACASACDDPGKVILCGLAEIPRKSRLFGYVSDVVKMHGDGQSIDNVRKYVYERFDEKTGQGWCHTIPNAMIVTAALLYGGGDFGKSVCLAVETGFDTDCNGATVGSIVGMMNGASSIGKEWTDPLHGTLSTSIFGCEKVDIEDLVKKTMEHIGAGK